MIFIYIYKYGIISVLNKYNVNLNFVFHFPDESVGDILYELKK